MRLRRPSALLGALVPVVAAVGLLVAGCTPGSVPPLPAPPSLPSTTATTAPVDLSGVGLAAVAGRTTTTVAIGPGGATITGTVTGPAGAVAGAVVHAERLVDDAVASADVVTADDGTYALPQILGGRYRVRAWKAAPDNLADTSPAVFFLGGNESKVLNVALQKFDGTDVSTAIAPSPPQVDVAANLVVQVVTKSVGTDGIVRSAPVTGVRVELFGPGSWRLASPAATTSDGSGRARWQLTCGAPGAQPISVVVGDSQTFPLDVPACEAAPADTTPTSDPGSSTTTAKPVVTTSTTAKAATTTTSARGGSSTTTTTAKP
ncbi:MAG TPA: carboxypeptidase-like regulatory domain-containing protein [Acidimicrobiales bacterium]|nr:carboxypeptidase-like regulatory domain-containing protein [Acidimicrobiales bacterium]